MELTCGMISADPVSQIKKTSYLIYFCSMILLSKAAVRAQKMNFTKKDEIFLSFYKVSLE